MPILSVCLRREKKNLGWEKISSGICGLPFCSLVIMHILMNIIILLTVYTTSIKVTTQVLNKKPFCDEESCMKKVSGILFLWKYIFSLPWLLLGRITRDPYNIQNHQRLRYCCCWEKGKYHLSRVDDLTAAQCESLKTLFCEKYRHFLHTIFMWVKRGFPRK